MTHKLKSAFVCTYHNEEDYSIITSFFQEECQLYPKVTEGFMLICEGDGNYSFRKGVVKVDNE